MTYTTFEDVLKYVTAAAFAGEIDDMQSVSSRVLTGRMIDIGRGGNNFPKVSATNPTGNRFVELLQASTKGEISRGRGRGRGRARGRGNRGGRGGRADAGAGE